MLKDTVLPGSIVAEDQCHFDLPTGAFCSQQKGLQREAPLLTGQGKDLRAGHIICGFEGLDTSYLPVLTMPDGYWVTLHK